MSALLLSLALLSSANASPGWQRQVVRTKADFRGVCAVSAKIAWVSGASGKFARTTDGGATWSVGTVPGADKLDFRDTEAFDELVAYLLSAGPGGDSRIYKTADGGATWALQFRNTEPEAFYDALAFWDRQSGLALSDPVRGQFRLLATDDGGTTWKPVPVSGMPPALSGEGAFAASGTCLAARAHDQAWFVTGGARTARIFRSTDRGRNWTAKELPLLAGSESAGAFAVAFRDGDHGLAVGGDYRKPAEAGPNAVSTPDGGKTWKATGARLPFRSGVAWAGDRWVAVGTSGSHQSPDGIAWTQIDSEGYHAVSFTPNGDGWAVGPQGIVARYTRHKSN